MSRFSINSSLALFQSVITDPDATSSSTSSNSAINNSSNSLSISPAIEREIRIARQSHQTSNHLLELQREIKEEEDEIFADINSLINNRSDLYSSLDDTDFEDNNGLANSICQTNVSSGQYINFPDEDHGYGQEEEDEVEVIRDEKDIAHQLQHEYQQQLQHEEDENQQFIEEHDFASCNRTGQQQNQQQHYQAIQQKDIQQVTSNLPKPCVFFLEGNCRRSDCKYSHDLSSITCKYWIEGFCFKGEMCPFLHSFTPNDTRDTNLLDDEGLSLSKKNLTPTFVIESEADFPSLPLDVPNVTLSDSTQRNVNSNTLTKTIKNQILSSNPAVVFKSTKKKRKKG